MNKESHPQTTTEADHDRTGGQKPKAAMRSILHSSPFQVSPGTASQFDHLAAERSARLEDLKARLVGYAGDGFDGCTVADVLADLLMLATREQIDFDECIAAARWHAGCHTLAKSDDCSIPQDVHDRAAELASTLTGVSTAVSTDEVSRLAETLQRGDVLNLDSRQIALLARLRPLLDEPAKTEGVDA